MNRYREFFAYKLSHFHLGPTAFTRFKIPRHSRDNNTKKVKKERNGEKCNKKTKESIYCHYLKNIIPSFHFIARRRFSVEYPIRLGDNWLYKNLTAVQLWVYLFSLCLSHFNNVPNIHVKPMQEARKEIEKITRTVRKRQRTCERMKISLYEETRQKSMFISTHQGTIKE